MTTDTNTPDEIIWRPDLCTKLKVQSECIRRWIKAGKLPKPDVELTRRTMGWRMSTLHAAGIKLV